MPTLKQSKAGLRMRSSGPKETKTSSTTDIKKGISYLVAKEFKKAIPLLQGQDLSSIKETTAVKKARKVVFSIIDSCTVTNQRVIFNPLLDNNEYHALCLIYHSLEKDANQRSTAYCLENLVNYYHKNYKKIVIIATKAIAIKPSDAVHYFYRALAYKNLNRNKLAIKDARRGYELDPLNKTGIELLAELKEEIKGSNDKEKKYEISTDRPTMVIKEERITGGPVPKTSREEKFLTPSHSLLGQQILEENLIRKINSFTSKYLAQIKKYEILNFSDFSSFLDMCENLKKISISQKDYVDSQFKKIKDQLHTTIEAVVETFFSNNIWIVALHYCQFLRNFFPESEACSYVAEANLQGQKGDFELSVELYTKALFAENDKQERMDAFLYYYRGKDYFSLGKYDLALADIDKAIELDTQKEVELSLKESLQGFRVRILFEKAESEGEEREADLNFKLPEKTEATKIKRPNTLLKRSQAMMALSLVVKQDEEVSDTTKVTVKPKKPNKKERQAQYNNQLTLQNIKLLRSSIAEVKALEQKINHLYHDKNWHEYKDTSKGAPLEIIRNTKKQLEDLASEINIWKMNLANIKDLSHKLSLNESPDVKATQSEAKEIISISETLKMDDMLLKAESRAAEIIAKANESKQFLENITGKIHESKRKIKSITANIDAEVRKLTNLEDEMNAFCKISALTSKILVRAQNKQNIIENIELKLNAYLPELKQEMATLVAHHKACEPYTLPKYLLNLIDETKHVVKRSEKLMTETIKYSSETLQLANGIMMDLQDLIVGKNLCSIARHGIEREAKMIKRAEQMIIESTDATTIELNTLKKKKKLAPDEVEEADDKSYFILKTIEYTLKKTTSEIKKVEFAIENVHKKLQSFNKKFRGEKPPHVPEFSLNERNATVTFLEYQLKEAGNISTVVHDQLVKTNRGMEYLDTIAQRMRIIHEAHDNSKETFVDMSEALESKNPNDINYSTLYVMQEKIKINIAIVEEELKSMLLILEKCSSETSVDSIKSIKHEQIIAKSILRKLVDIAIKADQCIHKAEDLRLPNLSTLGHSHVDEKPFCHSHEGGNPLRTDPRPRGKDNISTETFQKTNKKLPYGHFYTSSTPVRPKPKYRYPTRRSIFAEMKNLPKDQDSCIDIYYALVAEFEKKKNISPIDYQVFVFTLRAILVELAFNAPINRDLRNAVVHNMPLYFDTQKYSLKQLFASLQEYVLSLTPEETFDKNKISKIEDPMLNYLKGKKINQHYILDFKKTNFAEEDHYKKLEELVRFGTANTIEQSSLSDQIKHYASHALRKRVRDHAIYSGNIRLSDLPYLQILEYIVEHHPRLMK